jgi:hypothetical protein
MTDNIVARTVKGFCQAYGVGVTTCYKLIEEGEIEARKAGPRKTLIIEASAKAWAASQELKKIPPGAATQLYRHFDKSGNLLYVGISFSSVHRLSTHRATAGWFKKISRIEIENFSSREAAMLAERLAIENECPSYNIKLAALRATNVFGAVEVEELRRTAKEPRKRQYHKSRSPKGKSGNVPNT